MISVLLADEQDLIRIGLRTLIAATDGFTVTGEAPDGLAAVEAAISTQPDVVLMDIRMPGIDGLEATRRIAAGTDLTQTQVIVLTTRTLIREYTQNTPRTVRPHPQLGELTQRELEIVTLVAQGMTNREVATRLFISPATARTHASRAMIKLGARDRAQLVVFAYQSGLV